MIDQQSPTRIVLASNIDFVLVGPFEDKDAVLVRSSNAGADLVGFAVERGFEHDLESFPSRPPLFALGPWQRMMNLVVSHEITPDRYIRRAHYRFAWVGYCSRSDRISIEEKLNKGIRTIDAIRRNTTKQSRSEKVTLTADEVEWHLAPIIFECYKAHEGARRKVYVAKMVMGTYAIIGVVIAVAALVSAVVTR